MKLKKKKVVHIDLRENTHKSLKKFTKEKGFDTMSLAIDQLIWYYEFKNKKVIK